MSLKNALKGLDVDNPPKKLIITGSPEYGDDSKFKAAMKGLDLKNAPSKQVDRKNFTKKIKKAI